MERRERRSGKWKGIGGNGGADAGYAKDDGEIQDSHGDKGCCQAMQ